MRLPRPLRLSLWLLWVVAPLGATELRVQLTCRSLILQPATFVSPAAGQTALHFATYNPARVPLMEVDGQKVYVTPELRPRAGQPGTYETDYLLIRNQAIVEYGRFVFQLPATDSDADGLPDTHEVGRRVDVPLTGRGTSDDPVGAAYEVAGKWIREAPYFSMEATYTLTQTAGGSGSTRVSNHLGLLATEPGSTYAWMPGGLAEPTLRFSIRLRAAELAAVSAQFEVPFTVVDRDTVALAAFTFYDDEGSRNRVRASTLKRSGQRYFGELTFEDGDESTPWREFVDWHLEITDVNDANGNGIPDLSDLTPTITLQPRSVEATAGSDVTFAVSADSRGPMTYQWYHNDIAIPGATSATVSVPSVDTDDQGRYHAVVTTQGEGAASAAAQLTVRGAGPRFDREPAGAAVAVGGTSTLRAHAIGATAYQWFLHDVPILGATGPDLVLTDVQPWSAGAYRVRASAGGSSSWSSAAYVAVGRAYSTESFAVDSIYSSIRDGVLHLTNGKGYEVGHYPPAFVTRVRFRFTGSEEDELTLRWRSTTLINGTTPGLSLTLACGSRANNLSLADASGSSTATRPIPLHTWQEVQVVDTGALVRVFLDGVLVFETSTSLRPGPTYVLHNRSWSRPAGSNALDRVTEVDYVFVSDVVAPAEAGERPRLSNLSTRGFAGHGDEAMIAGFVTQGGAPHSLLLRAAGPALAAYGVAGALQDPGLALTDPQGHVLAANNDWSVAAGELAAERGAFPFAAGSRDAATVASLTAGLYSLRVTPNSGDAGVVLAEVYGAGPGATARITNLSTRARVGGGAGELIAGIIVSGSGPRQVLIRVVGPTLAAYGLPTALADPRFSIRNVDGQTLLENDQWSDAPNLAAIRTATRTAGAFELPLGSSDAAALVYLMPGVYTCVASARAGESGIVLIEAYQVGE